MTKRELSPKEKDYLKYAMEQYNHWRSVLEVYEVLPSVRGTTTIVEPILPSFSEDGSAYTFLDFVEELLADGRPRTTKEIKEEFLIKTGRDIELKNFSSKLKARQVRTGRIQNIKFEKLPLDRRYFWILPHWLDEKGELKPRHKKKIKEFAKGE